MTTAIIFIVILAVLVLAHEAGHFLVAKLFRMRVDEFGFGFPPKLISKKIGETEYSLNLFPIGGFVKIFGESDTGEPDIRSSAGSFLAKPKYAQAMVVMAGVVSNILLAWVLISVGFMIGLPTSLDAVADRDIALVVSPAVTITGTIPNSPADRAGLRVGDEIVALSAGAEFLNHPLDTADVKGFIAAHGNDPIGFTYRRGNGNEQVISITPVSGILEGESAIGISMDTIGLLHLPFFRAFKEGAAMTVSLVSMTAAGLWHFFGSLFAGTADLSSVTGPVGLVGVVGEASAFGFVYVLLLAAIISINLAIINFLPFPALDGGRFLFILIEAIKGSDIDIRLTNAVNVIGFFLIIMLMVVVTYNDLAIYLTRFFVF
ncbi:MAG: hypothetical protein COZ49_01170 [Candidatus Yonathbacteria bacterium CG_4_10_14_3_um_filter_47_65]|uniref:Peptidase M50 domain-containing protein n=2 Tax=Parcubacteria group TaxID=1794811 RepID=A0A2M8D9F2_9BACT|nr:MAG: hypothetical protein AUJ44_02965 [Candidatus Nomurabacteria bacterium CG1_02_47_685]PIP03962.1 MAG: hypothetical protein COX54_01550 [Candidatus Yonathbacteria bacterium CG23_combo_of_CG06-09_8_20_14_all_46_18]PIQ33231.1 MAG: hypothetical protein COW61_00225 [Candidatus Yonathbacteria bacterium CG17_big_fil_post_rev_8_21_14_2_50_46_19]PIX56577.1 MAG: hypothetical protein COZ49_01170 [Candidatus Yonathbacteria bacterium CG_4_10_14_3_um_filter_47_65]PIY57426.1 MAG: hypothetical protein CO